MLSLGDALVTLSLLTRTHTPHVVRLPRCVLGMATHAVRLRKTRIVCISDTHNNTPKLPPGDVLIHAGDLTNQGSYDELERTVAWLEKAPFEVKIVVAGNFLYLGCVWWYG